MKKSSFCMLFLFFAVTGVCAAAAYAVSLILLFVFWFNTANVGNKALTLAATVPPAFFFAAAAMALKMNGLYKRTARGHGKTD